MPTHPLSSSCPPIHSHYIAATFPLYYRGNALQTVECGKIMSEEICYDEMQIDTVECGWMR